MLACSTGTTSTALVSLQMSFGRRFEFLVELQTGKGSSQCLHGAIAVALQQAAHGFVVHVDDVVGEVHGWFVFGLAMFASTIGAICAK